MRANEAIIAGLTNRRMLVYREVAEGSRKPVSPGLYTGIEVEGENCSVPQDAYFTLSNSGWERHHDGSLRDDGVEFTLSEPLFGSSLAGAIDGLYQAVEEDGLEFYQSPRSGTHVHLNMTDRPLSHLQAMTALVYCIDPVLFKFADEDRQWCSYCNSLNTIPSSVMQVLLTTYTIDEGDWYAAWRLSEHDRYYGFNITSISKYGSVEFRYFPTPVSKEQLWSWVDVCHAIYEVSAEFQDEELPAMAVIEAIKSSADEVLRKIEELSNVKLRYDGWEEGVKELADDLLTTMSVQSVSPSSVSRDWWSGSGVSEAQTDDGEVGSEGVPASAEEVTAGLLLVAELPLFAANAEWIRRFGVRYSDWLDDGRPVLYSRQLAPVDIEAHDDLAGSGTTNNW